MCGFFVQVAPSFIRINDPGFFAGVDPLPLPADQRLLFSNRPATRSTAFATEALFFLVRTATEWALVKKVGLEKEDSAAKKQMPTRDRGGL